MDIKFSQISPKNLQTCINVILNVRDTCVLVHVKHVQATLSLIHVLCVQGPGWSPGHFLVPSIGLACFRHNDMIIYNYIYIYEDMHVL